MCSLGAPDDIDPTPIENVANRNVINPMVEQNVIPPDPPDPDSIQKPSDSESTPQDISDAVSIATLVETIGDHTDDHMPSPALPIAISPKSINLDNLPLHSPSSEIVGTPFANDNTRFEYPFPDNSQTGSSSATSPSVSPSSGSFPSLSTSCQILTQMSFAPPSNRPSYNPTHPKLKVQANPPVPPNLVKRRLRWNLSLLGRRKSAGSQQSTTGDESTMMDVADGQDVASPPGSPNQDRAKH